MKRRLIYPAENTFGGVSIFAPAENQRFSPGDPDIFAPAENQRFSPGDPDIPCPPLRSPGCVIEGALSPYMPPKARDKDPAIFAGGRKGTYRQHPTKRKTLSRKGGRFLYGIRRHMKNRSFEAVFINCTVYRTVLNDKHAFSAIKLRLKIALIAAGGLLRVGHRDETGVERGAEIVFAEGGARGEPEFFHKLRRRHRIALNDAHESP